MSGTRVPPGSSRNVEKGIIFANPKVETKDYAHYHCPFPFKDRAEFLLCIPAKSRTVAILSLNGAHGSIKMSCEEQ